MQEEKEQELLDRGGSDVIEYFKFYKAL